MNLNLLQGRDRSDTYRDSSESDVIINENDVYFNENDVIIEMHTFNDDVYEIQNDRSVGIRRYLPDGRVVNVGVVPKGAKIGVLSCSSVPNNHSSPVTYYALHDNVHLKKVTSFEQSICLAILRTISCFCILKDETLLNLIQSKKFRRETYLNGDEIITKETTKLEEKKKAYIILQGEVRNEITDKNKRVPVGTKFEGEIFGESIFRSNENNEEITRTAFSIAADKTQETIVLSFGMDLFNGIGESGEENNFKREVRFQINEFDRLNRSRMEYLDYEKLKK